MAKYLIAKSQSLITKKFMNCLIILIVKSN